MSRRAILLIAFFVAFSGCNQLEDVNSNTEAKNASAIASFMILAGKGTWRQTTATPHVAIDAQILYTVGQLNGVNSVGRLDQIKISDIETEEMADGCAITYQATSGRLGYEEKASETYTFLLLVILGKWPSINLSSGIPQTV